MGSVREGLQRLSFCGVCEAKDRSGKPDGGHKI